MRKFSVYLKYQTRENLRVIVNIIVSSSNWQWAGAKQSQ
jgi:hypothetical protein